MLVLRNPKLIYLKGFLFLLCGALAATILLIEHPEARTILLLAIAIWCFARFYYFAFYVIERYMDANFRFFGVDVIREISVAEEELLNRKQLRRSACDFAAFQRGDYFFSCCVC